MELQVANALRRIGEPFSFDLTETIGVQQYGGRSLVFLTPLHVQGQYVFDGKAFSLTGSADTVLQSVCARCAESFEEPLHFDFSERFVKASEYETQEDDEECYPYEGDRISLDTAVMDNLYLQLPLISVCREDCRGLCPVCGVNRNHAACSCEQVKPEGPFAALSGLNLEDE